MLARKPVLIAAATAALAVPAAAMAEVLEVAVPAATPPLTAACPDGCVVLAKVTGYQLKTATVTEPMVAKRSGRIVAWSVTLGRPNATQLRFFKQESNLGESEANISVLRPSRNLRSQLVQQGAPQRLERYFGQTVQFPLVRSISVRRGDIIALTSKTWAPVMAVSQPAATSWRASRGKGRCEDTSGTDYAQSTLQTTVQYRCIYRGVQLLYSVTMVTNPSST